MKYDIITFGSATLDIFLRTKQFDIKQIKKFITKKGVCFPFGSKVDIKDLYFFTGGGGTNTAAFFAFQGLKTGYCGMIGNDFAGQEVLQDLKRFNVDTKFTLKTKKAGTNLSVIFSWGRDRTAFVWRDASERLTKKHIFWQNLKTKWLYLAPLSGELVHIFKPIIDFAKKNNIKVFANPGNSQIVFKRKKLAPILKNIDILLLNQEEASLLTGIDYKKENQIFKKLDELVPGIVIMTKGAKGAVVSDGNYVWTAKAPKVSVVEKTGAGDAFGSGFLTGYIKTHNIEQALQFGIKNAVKCIQKPGAKQGFLRI